MDYWKTSTASTPEKTKHIEATFKLTPNTQTRLFRDKDRFSAAKKRLFRTEGGGRHQDEFWVEIEKRLLDKFTARRALGCIVHRRHLINFVYTICAELDINLIVEAEKRKWKNPAQVIRKRVDRFCKRNKIKTKRASRQLHKEPKVI